MSEREDNGGQLALLLLYTVYAAVLMESIKVAAFHHLPSSDIVQLPSFFLFRSHPSFFVLHPSSSLLSQLFHSSMNFIALLSILRHLTAHTRIEIGTRMRTVAGTGLGWFRPVWTPESLNSTSLMTFYVPVVFIVIVILISPYHPLSSFSSSRWLSRSS